MPPPIVECIPNFSEARRPEVVEAIAQAITSVPGVSLLDRHSDLDHNRTVLTFVGLRPQRSKKPLSSAIAKAAELINLDQHTGEHPRIGATDVVPFVPIRASACRNACRWPAGWASASGKSWTSRSTCTKKAATRPERKNLENIRRGQYEGSERRDRVNPEREPDFGPKQLGRPAPR